MNTNIWRLNCSSYFEDDFISNEKKALEKISGIKYFSPEDTPSTPVEILITNTHTDLSGDHRKFIQNSKLIIHANSGYDNFNLSFLKNYMGDVILGNEIRSHAVASAILKSFFNWSSPLTPQKVWDYSREWNRSNIQNTKILILGFGHIGKIIKQSLSPLSSLIDIYDPYQGYKAEFKKNKYNCVIFACGLNDQSKNLVDLQFLTNLSQDACIINMARGELLRNELILGSLEKRKDLHFYLDVFEKEPASFEVFSNYPRVHCTSHIAGVYKDISKSTISFIEKAVKSFISGEGVENFNYLKNNIYNNELI